MNSVEKISSQHLTAGELMQAQTGGIDAVLDIAPLLKSKLGSAGDLKDIGGDFKSYVTHWDTAAQSELIDNLKQQNPMFGFYAEEGGVKTDANIYWTIDPIDGTEHFMRGNGAKSHTAIALMERQTCQQCPDEHVVNVPVVSVICNFESGSLYTATSDTQAEKRVYDLASGEFMSAPIEVGGEMRLVECYGSDDSRAKELEVKLEKFLGVFVIRNAAASYSLIDIARGHQDALFVLDNPYTGQHDIAPGALLVIKAGGEAHNVGRTCLDVNPLKTAHRGVGNIIISNKSVSRETVDRFLAGAIPGESGSEF